MTKTAIDLHIHTKYSDGVYLPEELVIKAKEQGVTTIAITDHDCVAGVAEGLAAGKKHALEVIPGIELSCVYQGDLGVHLLGYFIDSAHKELIDILEQMQKARFQRGVKIIKCLNNQLLKEGKAPLAGVDLTQLGLGALGRPHLARLLIAAGYAVDINDAFTRYLIPCNFPKQRLPLAEGINLIKKIGGVTVLAHPKLIASNHNVFPSLQEQEQLIRELIALGVEGIETFYPKVTAAEVALYLQLAQQFQLLVTAGSDFHSEKESFPLGCYPVTEVPAATIATALKEYIATRED